MNINKIEKELEKRKTTDSILASLTIPLIIFIIGVVSNAEILFNLRNDFLLLLVRIILIFIVWLILAVILNILWYLIKEILILNNEKRNWKIIIANMKVNFNDLKDIIVFNVILIFITFVACYLFVNKPSTDIVIEVLIISLIIFFILSVLYTCIKKKINIKHMSNVNTSDKMNFICKCLSILVCYIVSMIFIAFLLIFYNKRNIDIIYNKNGIIECRFDNYLLNDDVIKFEIYNKNFYIDGLLDKNNILSSISLHVSSDKKNISTMSSIEYMNNLPKELSPSNFYMPNIINCCYINLNKYITNDKNYINELDDVILITLTLELNNHKFIVYNKFKSNMGVYEFANDRVHLESYYNLCQK